MGGEVGDLYYVATNRSRFYFEANALLKVLLNFGTE